MSGKPEPQEEKVVIREKDWKYSVTVSLGGPGARRDLKARGDNIEEVIKDIEKLKSEVSAL